MSSSVSSLLSRGGELLEPGIRGQMEHQLGADFGRVRVQRGPLAAATAADLDARAFAVGRTIVFGEGAYAPKTAEGRRTLAHELVHTLQSREDPTSSSFVLGRKSSPAEAEAESVAGRVGASPAARPVHQELGRTIARQPGGPGSTTATGTLVFIQVDLTKNTVTFVTSSGSLVYDLDGPASIPVGSHTFDVVVTGNNVSMKASVDSGLAVQSTFRYRIKANQPDPSTLLRGLKKVSVKVIKGSDTPTSGSLLPDPTQATAGIDPLTQSLPVTFTAVPLGGEAGPSGAVPAFSSRGGGALPAARTCPGSRRTRPGRDKGSATCSTHL